MNPPRWSGSSASRPSDSAACPRLECFGRNELRRTCLANFPTVCFTFPVAIKDLAIGVLGQAVGGAAGAGAVHVFYGSLATNGLDFSSEQIWTHSNTGTSTSQAGEFFGGALY